MAAEQANLANAGIGGIGSPGSSLSRDERKGIDQNILLWCRVINLMFQKKLSINDQYVLFVFVWLAHNLRLPITVMDIINLPMDEFNDLLSKHELTEEQLTLCRDIRRRGKNKVCTKLCFYFS